MTQHVEVFLPPALRTRFSDVRVVTETPADLAEECPLITAVGVGGSGDEYQFDTPRVDLDVFGVALDGKSARENARDLAQEVHDWLLRDAPGQMFGTAFVLSVTEFMSPTWTPYDNTDVRRFTLSVQLRIHDRSSS